MTTYAGHVLDIKTDLDTSVAYRYHRLSIDPPAAQWSAIAELVFYEGVAAANTTATYPFVSDGTYLYYGVDPGGSSSGGNTTSIFTAGRALISDSNGSESVSSVTSSELAYLSGATAAIQSQINSISSTLSSKADISALQAVSSAVMGITTSLATKADLTALTAVSNAVMGATTSTAAKLNRSGDTMTGDLGLHTSVTPSRFLMIDSARKIVSSSNAVTDAEFGYLSGVTQSLQTQLNAKGAAANHVLKAGDTMSGNLMTTGQLVSAPTTTSSFTCNSTTLNFNTGNVQTVTASIPAGACTVLVSNVLDGGAYNVLFKGSATTNAFTPTFSQSGLSWKWKPAQAATTAGGETLYTLLRVGTVVYINWIAGY